MFMPVNKDRTYIKIKTTVLLRIRPPLWDNTFMYRHLNEICADKIADGLFISLSGQVYSNYKGFTKISIWGNDSGDGYLRCSYRRRSKNIHTSRTIHNMLGHAFLNRPSERHDQIAHYDSNKLNNRIENLRWATSQENMDDYYHKEIKHKRGRESHPTFSKIELINMNILSNMGVSTRKISKIFNISKSAVHTHLKRLRNGDYKNVTW